MNFADLFAPLATPPTAQTNRADSADSRSLTFNTRGRVYLEEEDVTIRAKAGLRLSALSAAPNRPPLVPLLCPTCWTRRIVAPIDGPTCSCKPYAWPVWTTEQIANLQPALDDRLINAPIAPTAPQNRPPLIPLESPWIDGARYQKAGATEWPNRLDLYVQDPSGPWIRQHGVLISVSEP